jgi:hypothetical protein
MTAKQTSASRSAQPRCGLCGKAGKLVRSDCCGNWVCDDKHDYGLFSYPSRSCHRNHMNYTLCGYHYSEGHKGDWKDCEECRNSFAIEKYVWYGTNEYNFEKLPNPPSCEPPRCSKCGNVITFGVDGFTQNGDEYLCEACAGKQLDSILHQTMDHKRRGKQRP